MVGKHNPKENGRKDGLVRRLPGYLVTTQYRFETIGNAFKYYRNRFFRIYPLFFAALTLFLMMGAIGPSMYLKSAFMTNMFIHENLLTLWFITMLFILYVVAPIFLYSYSLYMTIFLTSGFWGSLVAIHVLTGYIDLRLPMYLVPFTLGIMMGRSDFLRQISMSKYVQLLCLSLFFGALWLLPTKDEFIELIIIDVAIVISIPLFLSFGRLLAGIVPTRLLLFISYASFVMYLSHRILFALSGKLYHSSSMVGQIMYYGFFVLPVTVILSYFIQVAYDKLMSANSRSRQYSIIFQTDVQPAGHP
jgi:peptidoglycan/LPS O-acetylase OafA/YrhL